MDAQFWIKAWNEGRTNFHQADYHEKLVEYFPKFAPKKGQKVLVPLCGKSKDLLWLHERGLQVHGIELHEDAVKAFFLENNLPPPPATRDGDFTRYSHQNIMLQCGDFFNLKETGAYDFVYDRGALVALPRPMRKTYAQVVTRALKQGGKCLLIVYEYDPSQMEGPPFSVDGPEIHELYGAHFTIELAESKKPNNEGPRLAAQESLRQNIYLLTRGVLG